MPYAALRDNLARVREEIAGVQAREGLTGAVRVVGITKGHPAEAIRAALAADLAEVGENRIQEALEKQQAVGDLPVRWHLVGHVQTNKAKHVPGRFTMVHSVDSVRVVDALEKAAETALVDVLVQVNVAGEEQKFGCEPTEARVVLERAREASHLRVRGLMTMAPFTDDEGVQRRTFQALRELRDSLVHAGDDLPELSMGMSGDYLSAVAEGATIVRLGTVLFGRRSA